MPKCLLLHRLISYNNAFIGQWATVESSGTNRNVRFGLIFELLNYMQIRIPQKFQSYQATQLSGEHALIVLSTKSTYSI